MTAKSERTKRMASSSDTSQKEKPVPLGGKVWAFSGNGGRTSVCGGYSRD